MNMFFEQLNEIILNNEVFLLTYKDKKNNQYSKYFSKINEKYFDETSQEFTLLSVIENKQEQIEVDSILLFEIPQNKFKQTFLATVDSKKAEYQKFKTITKISNFDLLFFDKTTNTNKLKIACLFDLDSLDKLDNSTETLTYMKEFWKSKIKIHKEQTLNYINSELNSEENVFDEESLNEIKNLILEYNPNDDLEHIHTALDLVKFWPTILLPAPDFVNDIYNEMYGYK